MMRLAALTAFAALALAGCSGETETVTVSGPTVTETVTETVADDENVAQLAEALCREYGSLARTFGGFESDEEVADALAGEVDPELREATRRGCLQGFDSG